MAAVDYVCPEPIKMCDCDCCDIKYIAIKMYPEDSKSFEPIAIEVPRKGPEFNNKKGGRRKYPRR